MGPDNATPSHTPLCNSAGIGGGTDTRGAGQYVTGSTTTTMDYSMDGSDHWNIIGAALQEAVVGDITINMVAATLVSAPQDVAPVGGAVTVPMSGSIARVFGASDGKRHCCSSSAVNNYGVRDARECAPISRCDPRQQ